MAINFYRTKDPKTGREMLLETGTNRHIGPTEFGSGANFSEGNQTPAPPQQENRASGIQGYADSNLTSHKNNLKFLELAKEAIKRKQGYNEDIQSAKTYWRTQQRDPMTFTDERLQLLSPAQQQSLREGRYAAAGANLQGLQEEEANRGARVEDILGGIADVQTAATRDSEGAMNRRLQELQLRKGLQDLDGDYDFNDKGGLSRTYASATAKNIADAIKQIESGGNYDAKGGSGEGGAYQYMPATWDSYSKQYASEVFQQSRAMPMTRENQDAVTEFMIDKWLKQGLTPQQIAAKWNSGSEIGWENKVSTGKGGKLPPNKWGQEFSVPEYVNKFTSALGKIVPEEGPAPELNEVSQANKSKFMTEYGYDNNDVKDWSADDWMDYLGAARDATYDTALEDAKKWASEKVAGRDGAPREAVSPTQLLARITRKYGDKLNQGERESILYALGFTKANDMFGTWNSPKE